MSRRRRSLLQSGANRALFGIDNIAAAFSLNMIGQSYNGPLVRVRRNEDSAEIDIYARPDGSIDASAITSFLNSSSPASTTAFITTWYDQSGNGRNASMSTAANQATFSSTAGNGNPALVWGANTVKYSLGNVLGDIMEGASAKYTVFQLLDINSVTGYLWSKVGDDSQNPFTANLRGPAVLAFDAVDYSLISQTGASGNYRREDYTASTGAQVLRHVVDIGNGTAADIMRVYKDEALQATTIENAGSGQYTDLATNFWIGGVGPLSSTSGADMDLGAFIFYNGEPSSNETAAIESALAAQWGL